MDRQKPQIPVIEPDGHIRPFDEIMDEALMIAVEHYGGKVAAVAEHLKVSRSTIYHRLERRQRRGQYGQLYPFKSASESVCGGLS